MSENTGFFDMKIGKCFVCLKTKEILNYFNETNNNLKICESCVEDLKEYINSYKRCYK